MPHRYQKKEVYREGLSEKNVDNYTYAVSAPGDWKSQRILFQKGDGRAALLDIHVFRVLENTCVLSDRKKVQKRANHSIARCIWSTEGEIT